MHTNPATLETTPPLRGICGLHKQHPAPPSYKQIQPPKHVYKINRYEQCLPGSFDERHNPTIPQSMEYHGIQLIQLSFLTECHGMPTFHVQGMMQCRLQYQCEDLSREMSAVVRVVRVPSPARIQAESRVFLRESQTQRQLWLSLRENGKHNLERCRFFLDFMVLVRFVLVLTFSDIC